MFCSKCGARIPDGSEYCPACGEKLNFTSELKKVCSSSLFLAVCILMSVVAVLNIKGIFAVLYTVALWLIYANAVSKTESMKNTGFKFIHVVLKVSYILSWVCAGIVAVSGIVAAALCFASQGVLSQLMGSAVDYSADVSAELSDLLNKLVSFLNRTDSVAIIGLAVLIGCIVFAAVAVALNICFTKYFMNYFAALSDAAEKNTKAKLKDRGAAVRFLICGIYSAVSVFSTVVSINVQNGNMSFNVASISSACYAAALIIGFVITREEKAN